MSAPFHGVRGIHDGLNLEPEIFLPPRRDRVGPGCIFSLLSRMQARCPQRALSDRRLGLAAYIHDKLKMHPSARR